jgi:hypothetical protein
MKLLKIIKCLFLNVFGVTYEMNEFLTCMPCMDNVIHTYIHNVCMYFVNYVHNVYIICVLYITNCMSTMYVQYCKHTV